MEYSLATQKSRKISSVQCIKVIGQNFLMTKKRRLRWLRIKLEEY